MKRINISELIRRNIQEHGYCLEKIESIIQKECDDQLNTVDRVHIENKYIKYCLDYWVDEIGIFLNEGTTIDTNVIQKLIALDNIRHFDEIPMPFNALKYYKLLMQHKDIIAQHKEEMLMRRFKEKYLKISMTYSNIIAAEIDFLKALLEFLDMFEKCEKYPDMSELSHLYNVDISNDKFFQIIMDLDVINYDVKLKRLQYAAQPLINKKHIILMNKYKEIIQGYFQSTIVKKLTIDDRVVIEIIGGNFHLSDKINAVNSFLLEDPQIQEVRFICSGIIYIDADLENSIWHGRNIVVYAKAIRVCNTIKWDISGETAKSLTSIKAITDDNGNGVNGKHGKCGESGGNIFIYADNVLGAQQLVILSNGGDGGNGQHGGDGRNGNNGTGISYADLKSKFPSAEKYNRSGPLDNLRTIVRKMRSIGNIRISWQNDRNCSVDEVIQNEWRSNTYVEAVTEEGHEIYFSFSISGGTFVLYKGSAGQSGGRGGAGGICGQGGYSGEMTSNDPHVVIIANSGKKGENGTNGKRGKHGENGWDMGFIDWLFWSEAVYYGIYQNKKIKLEYCDDSHMFSFNAEQAYVPYRKFLKSKYTYAQMSTCNIPKPASVTYTEREEFSMQSERQTQAERKKNILQNHIFAQYSEYMIKTNIGLYQNLQSEMKNTENHSFRKIMNDKAQQMKEISQINFTRAKPSYSNIKTCDVLCSPVEFSEVQQICDQSTEVLLASLHDGSLDDWSKLKTVQLEYYHFEDLFLLFKSWKKRYMKEKKQKISNNTAFLNIEELLMQKYRLAILQQIAIKMSQYQHAVDTPPLTPENAVKYLIRVKDNPQNDLGFHNELENLQQYFFEDNDVQRKKISAFLTEKNMSKYTDAFKHSIGAFVMDEGEMKEAHPIVKKYYNEYTEFVGKQEIKLKEFLKESELEVGYYDETIAQWFRSLNKADMQAKLKKDMKKDERLKPLYNVFVKRFSVRFQWDDCCEDPEILIRYVQHIQEYGPLSPSYRELLAYIFNMNICVYIIDQSDNIHLLDVHNMECTETIYILHTSQGFTQLDIDQNLLDLDIERGSKAAVYTKLIAEVDSLQQKEDCDEYLEEEMFLSGNEDHNINPGTAINEKEDIYNIIRFFSSPEEKQKLKFLLEKISSKFIGQCRILQAITKCFSCNGRHVTYHELYYMINAILNFLVEDGPGLNVFCWITMAYPQHQWINEIILLKLQNHFQRLLLTEIYEWRGYLANIQNRDTLLLLNTKLEHYRSNKNFSTQCIQDILYLLSNISKPVPGLQQLELSEWPYAIKEKYWTTKLSVVIEWEDEKLQRASYYLLSLENSTGTYLVEKFIDLFVQKNIMFQSNNRKNLSLNRFLFWRKKNTNTVSLSADDFLQILSNFYNGEWNFSEKILTTLANCSIDEWPNMMKETFPITGEDRNTSKLIEMITDNGNTSPRIVNDLVAIECVINDMKQMDTMNNDAITKKIAELKSNIHNCQEESAKIQYVRENATEILGLIDDVIQMKKKFRLRDTQKLAILTLLRNQNNTLMQVSTGEGKSLIVVALSIFKALYGQKTDIITSSSVLAKRDAEINRDIYELFSASVAHNCDNDVERRKEVYSCNYVVYGELAGFQRDYLLDRFYGKNILGDRNFENVVVDEVDSMLLDKGNNMLYLSHDLPCLDKLESVYVYIWQLINRPFTNKEEYLQFFDSKAIRQDVLRELHGLVSKERISKFDSHMNNQQVNTIWEHLIKYNIINSDGYLLQDDVKEENIRNALPSDFKHYERHLIYLFRDITSRVRSIYIPNYLKPFVALHLDAWINSAKMALFMQERRDYIVDVDRKGSRPDLKANITIIDRDTGTDQTNSQWDEALHQFLQLKHGCKLSMQSLKAVFVSNVRYLKFYNNLYGLTGTLGSHRERDLLREIYGVDFVTIPTTKARRFREYNPIVCSNLDEWKSKIREEANVFVAAGRSVLIICETVEDVESLHCVFGYKNASYVHTYTRDYEFFDVAAENKRLCSGQVIIATNLAGRGTDIKITDELDQAEGLHVCLTYLPNNNRVEQQAFGRAARCGNNGSGRLIILGSRGTYNISQTSRLKTERDLEEIRRISNIKLHYETRISVEEDAFCRFKEEYLRMKESLEREKVAKEVTETLLRSCLDEWAFWLDGNSGYINGSLNEQDIREYNASLHKLIHRFRTLQAEESESWICWTREPTQMVKLGKYFAQNKQQDIAIKLFDRVIKNEPFFSETAHYYKAFSLIKKISKDDRSALEELKSELRQASVLLEKHRDYALVAGNIIDTLKHRNPGIMQIDAFKEQHINISRLYQIFLQSIDDIFGHHVTPQSFERYDISEELAETLYEDLTENDVLKKPRISKYISEKSVKTISERYGIIWSKLSASLVEYRGCDVDLKQLENKLKDSVEMPNREDFWKQLVKLNILTDEVKYVKIIVKKLRNIDPSLLNSLTDAINEQRLEKLTIQCDKQELIFNVKITTGDNDSEDNEDDITLEKKVLKDMIGDEKYKILKRRNVFYFNKKAIFDSSKIDSVTIPSFDSITLWDFTDRDILPEDAQQILTDLVKQKILENKGNDHYRLVVPYNKIADLRLSCCGIYENFVISLLNICFMYRLALQKLARDLEEEKPVNLQIMIRPHQSIIYSLIDERIIKPAKVSNNITDIKGKLKCMYDRIMTKDTFMRTLYQNNLIPQTSEDEKLLKYIAKEKWIDVVGSTEEYKKKILSGEIIVDPLSIAAGMTSSFILLSYLRARKSNKIAVLIDQDILRYLHLSKDSIYEGPTETIEKIINARNHLGRNDTIQNITAILERLRNAFRTLDAPDCCLMPLTKHIEANKLFSNNDYPGEELHVFTVNGLDDLLMLQERPWTRNMILKTTGIVVLGIMQIVVGSAIQLLSAGSLSWLGGALVCEGISDIFFAAMCFRSGHFSWNSYMQHKIMSLAITGLTFSVGAWLSYGKTTSSFATEIIGPNVSAGGTQITEMTGTALLTQLTRGGGGLVRAFVKRVACSTMEGIAFGLTSTAVDAAIDNYLQNLCRDIGHTILTEIDQTVDQHDMSSTLIMAYQTLGRENATTMIKEISDSYFVNQDNSELARLCSRAVYSVANVVKQAKSIQLTSSSLLKIKTLLKVMGPTITVAKTILVLSELRKLTSEMLDTLNRDIQDKLTQLSTIDTQQTSDLTRHASDTDMNNFKQEIMDMWKSKLREQAGQIIDKEIVRPIMHTVAATLVNYAGKQIQEAYGNYKENTYSKEFAQYKEEYVENLKDLENASDEVRIQSEKQYHDNLKALLGKTYNPELFAAIIRENVQMDTTCVAACLPVLEQLLMNRGINVRGLTIIVEEELSGLSEKLSTAPEGYEDAVVRISLVDGHFQLTGDNTSSNVEERGASKNNCLYEALCQRYTELKDLTADEFREQIAKEIENNPEIQERLSYGWHRYKIAAGLIGGRKAPVRDQDVTDIYGQADEERVKPRWRINERDTDLRYAGILNNELLHEQRTEALNIALQKCNDYLKQTQSIDGKPVFVTPEDFKGTLYDRVFVTDSGFGEVEVGYFPVEMKTSVDVFVPETQEKATLVVEINLDNPSVSPVQHGPTDPHVGYKISGPKSAKYKTCGHILINEKGNEYLPHRRPDNIRVDPTKTPSNNNMPHRIPIGRLFHGPSNSNLVLERTDLNYDKSRIRSKSFVSIFY